MDFNHLVATEQPFALAVLGFYYGRSTALNDVASGKLFEAFAKDEDVLRNPKSAQFAVAICNALKNTEWNADPGYLAAFYVGSEDVEMVIS